MNTAEIYQKHHTEKSRLGFSVLEKERADWFLSHAPRGGEWLDIGCRDATLTKHFSTFAQKITGVDIDPIALEHARKNLPEGEFLQLNLLGDWTELQDRQFDVIVCSEVLEHVYFPKAVVERIAAHLRPGGVFLGSVPNAFFLKHRIRYLFGKRKHTPLDDQTHITQFNEAYLREVLSPVSSEVILEGYTRPPFRSLAISTPKLFAFDFLFCLKK
jgi:2-polyprenyl-3-methyl-5-hydroxy-6-metoxy-1,4-benzoquinol methylase